PSAAPATPRAAAAGAKLPAAVAGVIDMGIISRDGAAYKSLRAQIESQSKAWDADLKKKNDDLRKLEEDFRKQGPSLTPEQVTEKRKQFDTQLGEFQRQINVRRRQLADGEARVLSRLKPPWRKFFSRLRLSAASMLFCTAMLRFYLQPSLILRRMPSSV
ncbi:hypothetical protein VZ95_17515, partial [Elstera litoralis]